MGHGIDDSINHRNCVLGGGYLSPLTTMVYSLGDVCSTPETGKARWSIKRVRKNTEAWESWCLQARNLESLIFTFYSLFKNKLNFYFNNYCGGASLRLALRIQIIVSVCDTPFSALLRRRFRRPFLGCAFTWLPGRLPGRYRSGSRSPLPPNFVVWIRAIPCLS